MDNLKSLGLLWVDLAKNHRYRELVSAKDIQVFGERLGSEGLPFLTSTLPRIGKALDSYHSTTEWDCPENFSCDLYVKIANGLYPLQPLPKEAREALEIYPELDIPVLRIPKFLGLAIKKALEGDSVAVDCVRQLTYIFYKLEVRYEDGLVADFLAAFKKVDEELALDFSAPSLEIATKGHIARMKANIARVL